MYPVLISVSMTCQENYFLFGKQMPAMRKGEIGSLFFRLTPK